jgi:hypothetical protein
MAQAEAIKSNLDLIKRAANECWPAAAWLLERRHPELFARPEVQLNVGIQNNMNTPVFANGGSSFEVITCFYHFKTRAEFKKARRCREARPKFSPTAQLALPLVS